MSYRGVCSGQAAVIRACLVGAFRGVVSVGGWVLRTSLILLRPLVALVLIPLGMLFFFSGVLGGFLFEARGIVDHRWTLVGIGLATIALMRLYDGFTHALCAESGLDGRPDQ